jgi:L-threonylcarbamoyladenylate synthase
LKTGPIQEAAAVLRAGGIVAFPTETVYGLGADMKQDKAVCRIFEAKKRPSFDPLIVHVASVEEARTLWKGIPPAAESLMRRFWPGPLTLVLPKSAQVSDLVTAGLPTVAVRMPDHPMALELIRALGHPIAAPSANMFGHTSPTSAQHVAEDLGNAIDLIVDGGPCSVGVESTVLKIERGAGIILRPGGVSAEQLADVIPLEKAPASAKLESPGQLESHYAPWTRFVLLPKRFPEFSAEFDTIRRSFEESKGAAPRVGLLAFDKDPQSANLESVQVLSPKGDLVEAAAALFQAMRKLDKMNVDFILAEPVPEKGIGQAIMDRLRKASGGQLAGKDILC